MWVKQIAPNWRKPQPNAFQGTCVPSPQSSSVSDEPLRTSAHDNQRPGMGIMPHVPSRQISITTIGSLLNLEVTLPRAGKSDDPLCKPLAWGYDNILRESFSCLASGQNA